MIPVKERPITTLLDELYALDVTLRLEGESLHVSAPPGVLTAELRSELADNKPQLIPFLQRVNANGNGVLNGHGKVTIARVARDGQIAPMSVAQQRLWFLDQLEKDDSTSYNMPSILEIEGELDVSALKRSLAEVVRRHDSLRTRFIHEGDEPEQYIEPTISLPFELIEMADATPEAIEAMIAKMIHQPFNLYDAPLWLVRLLKVGEDRHLFVISIHHIISDDWSMNIFVQELIALYESACANLSSPLDPLNIQYPDYAVWHNEWLQSEAQQEQVAYWQKKLEGSLALLELPLDKPRPVIQRSRGATVQFEVAADITEKLKQLSREHDATLFMTLLTAFGVLLSRYSRQDDIVIGTPIANRTRKEVEPLIGFFVNTLAMRIDLADQTTMTFADLLRQVRQTAIEAYVNQDAPFEKLVELLQPERTLSYQPIFQVMFVLQNAPMETMTPSGVKLSQLTLEQKTSKFDLTLSASQVDKKLVCEFEYDIALFDKSTVERMGGHFVQLLSGIVAEVACDVARLPLLTADEEHQLLVEWNETAVSYPTDKTVIQLFEEQVKRTPDAIALVFEDEQLTYAELDRLANQLAHYLIEQGVKSETMVAVHLERSLEMIVALYSVLKTGGIYVPINSDYPLESIDHIMEDTAPFLVLTQKKLASSLEKSPYVSGQIDCLDDEIMQLNRYRTDAPNIKIRLDQQIYIIYTSGSTGRPKGVIVTHRALAEHTQTVKEAYQITLSDRVLQFASTSFDVALEQICAPLSCGAMLVVRGNGVWDIEQFNRKIADHRVTIADLSPTYFHHLVEAWHVDSSSLAMAQLRLILVGGEKINVGTVRLWEQIPDIKPKLLNAYGPTEATITATTFDLSAYKMRECTGTIPIGRPLAQRTTLILDANLQLVPIGVTGELHLGGQLAVGYLNRPELTAEKFIPNPFGEGRLYKTGDFCRYLPDGNIEFLGRIDQQVKIRGFRIELGEIEAVLNQHTAVRETVILVRKDTPNRKQLVAYIVKSEAISSAELRNYLSEKLPGYMVPAIYVELDMLPLTPNGKINRRALPMPDEISFIHSDEYVEPRNDFEKTMVLIWQKLLNLKQVGVYDNFFELGGDSLLILQVVSQSRGEGYALHALDMFQHQTIAELAGYMKASDLSVERQLEATTRAGELPLLVDPRWMLNYPMRDRHFYMACDLSAVHAPLDEDVLYQTIEYLINYHDTLRSRFIETEDGWRQYIDERREFSIETVVIDLTDVPVEQHYTHIKNEVVRILPTLNLEQTVFRVAIFRFKGVEKPNHLLFAAHHLILDNVSNTILGGDLIQIYAQLTQGQKPELPEKTTTIFDWTGRLIAYAQSAEIKQELAYWRSLPWEKIKPLPTDLPLTSESHSFGSSQTVSMVLEAKYTNSLQQQLPKSGLAMADAVIMAQCQALAEWRGGDCQNIKMIDSGRYAIPNAKDLDSSRIVGWLSFTRHLFLQSPTTNSLLDATQQISRQLSDVPNRGLGYELLLRCSEDQAIVTELEQYPTPEVWFNYVGKQSAAVQNAGFEPVPIDAPWQNVENKRPYHLFCVSALQDNGLRFIWEYSDTVYRQATIETVLKRVIEILTHLALELESKVNSLGGRKA